MDPDKLDSGFRRNDGLGGPFQRARLQRNWWIRGDPEICHSQKPTIAANDAAIVATPYPLAALLLHRDEQVEGRFLSSLIGPFYANDVIAGLLKRMLRSCVTFFVFLFCTAVRLHCHRCAAVSEVPGFLAKRRPARSNQEGDRLPGARFEARPVGSVNRGCQVLLSLAFGYWLPGNLNHGEIVRAVTTTVRHFENLAVGTWSSVHPRDSRAAAR